MQDPAPPPLPESSIAEAQGPLTQNVVPGHTACLKLKGVGNWGKQESCPNLFLLIVPP